MSGRREYEGCATGGLSARVWTIPKHGRTSRPWHSSREEAAVDEHPDEPTVSASDPNDTSEKPEPPRPVRGLPWMFLPALVGLAVGAVWSAYYSAVQRLDPATPIWVGGAVGLGVGAFLWAAFPYKRRRRRQPDSTKQGRS
jgi:hypothetical protein